MATTYEIQASYLADHDALGARIDALDKDLFDRQHAQLWLACDLFLKDRQIELEAQNTLTPQEQEELGELESLFPTPLPPDADTIRATELLETSAAVISMPEIWELLRIIGRRLGY